MGNSQLALEERPPNRELSLKGNLFITDPFGCLYWPDEEILVVSDLHLEKGSSFAKSRELIPPYDTGHTLAILSSRLKYWQPKTVISLGDSFHDPSGSTRLPEAYCEKLRELTRISDWIWIRGNHDPEAPEGFEGLDCDQISISNVVFRHEPAPGNPSADAIEICGHLHPAAKIRRRGKSVYRRCFASDGQRLIMPAMGAYTGGLNVKDKAFYGILNQTDLIVWMLGRHCIFEIDGQQLVA